MNTELSRAPEVCAVCCPVLSADYLRAKPILIHLTVHLTHYALSYMCVVFDSKEGPSNVQLTLVNCGTAIQHNISKL